MLVLVRPPLAWLRQKTMGRWEERGVDDVAVDNHYPHAGDADENGDGIENGENGDAEENGVVDDGDAADDYEDEEEETRV